MQAHAVADGLWRWTGFHPEWKQEVACVYLEAPDAIVVVDPLVPPEDADGFWRAFERDVRRTRLPVHVLVTVYWHTRSARELVERLGARVWALERGRRAIERRAGSVTDLYRPGDPLPGGVVAFPTGKGNEVVFWIPRHRALVPGDVILGDPAGGLRLCPRSWLREGFGHDELRARLRPLLDLPVERVLVSHGPPVLEGGADALRRLLA